MYRRGPDPQTHVGKPDDGKATTAPQGPCRYVSTRSGRRPPPVTSNP